MDRKTHSSCNSRIIIVFRNLEPLGVESIADYLRKGVMIKNIFDGGLIGSKIFIPYLSKTRTLANKMSHSLLITPTIGATTAIYQLHDVEMLVDSSMFYLEKELV